MSGGTDMDAATESLIDDWRERVAAREAISSADVDELESHLRDHLDDLTARGLAPDEAFMVAVKRVGPLDEVAQEYATEHSDRLWKQLTVETRETGSRGRAGIWWAVGLAFGTALAVKVPALFGASLAVAGDYYERNVVLLVLPFLAVFFLVGRRPGWRTATTVGVPFVAVALLINLYPFVTGTETGPGQTELLAIIHSVVLLWLTVGIAYAAGDWRSGRARMDFVRFTGEWFVYYVLMALGGWLLCALALALFGAIGLDAGVVIGDWVLPCGAAGAVIIAAWLVESKKNVIENIAPVLTKVFSPLMALLLIAAVVASLVQFDVIDDGRDLLIVSDLMLLIVLGLLLYALSARNQDAPASWFDRLQLVMLVAALALDVIVLIAMIGRIGAFGASPNRLASLGLNLILLVNLAGAAWLQLGFVRSRTRFARLERWQTSYVPVYFTWAAVVVVAFPPVFAFA